jgi:hypothetical protein
VSDAITEVGKVGEPNIGRIKWGIVRIGFVQYLAPDSCHTPGYCGKNQKCYQVKPNTFEYRGFGHASGLRVEHRQGILFFDLQVVSLPESELRLSFVNSVPEANLSQPAFLKAYADYPGSSIPRKVLTKMLRVVALFHAIFPDALCRVNVRKAMRTV